jgi:hypothetical protein
MKRLLTITLVGGLTLGFCGLTFAQSFYDNFAGAPIGVDTYSATNTNFTDSSGAEWFIEPTDPASIDIYPDSDNEPTPPFDESGEYLDLGYNPEDSSNAAGVTLNEAIAPGTYNLTLDEYVTNNTDSLGYGLSSGGYLISDTLIPLDQLNESNPGTWQQESANITVNGSNDYLSLVTSDGNSDQVDITNVRLTPTPEPVSTGLAIAGALFGVAMLKRKMT